MKGLSFMVIAGEASGDTLAAELVQSLGRTATCLSVDDSLNVQPLRTALAPRFFGAGGPMMAQAGVELALDLTQHSVIGISEVIKKYFDFRRMFNLLFRLAVERQPDVIVGVDYGGFNLRFGRAIKAYVRKHRREFTPWNPKLVQFISPQVWASRPGRAYTIAEDYDLLLSIFPFETAWYAQRVPRLRVEFVGHPMVERALNVKPTVQSPGFPSPRIVLLPGSRTDEIRRHLPVVTGAFAILRAQLPELMGTMVMPSISLAELARESGLPAGLEVRVGGLSAALATADLAITKSGTVTVECAFQGVPAVVFYRTSWPTYLIAKQVVSVKHLAMPNLLLGAPVYPEFIQNEATPENIARAALELMRDSSRRKDVRARLVEAVATLGGPGAAARAAKAILSLLS